MEGGSPGICSSGMAPCQLPSITPATSHTVGFVCDQLIPSAAKTSGHTTERHLHCQDAPNRCGTGELNDVRTREEDKLSQCANLAEKYA